MGETLVNHKHDKMTTTVKLDTFSTITFVRIISSSVHVFCIDKYYAEFLRLYIHFFGTLWVFVVERLHLTFAFIFTHNFCECTWLFCMNSFRAHVYRGTFMHDIESVYVSFGGISTQDLWNCACFYFVDIFSHRMFKSIHTRTSLLTQRQWAFIDKGILMFGGKGQTTRGVFELRA